MTENIEQVKVTVPASGRVSIADGGRYAGVSPRTIRRWIAEGKLPGYRIGGTLLQVRLEDLDALVAQVPTVGRAS